MLLVAYFTSLLLFCRQTDAATAKFTFKPSNQEIAIEARDFTLMWNYTLVGSILVAKILNTTDMKNEEEIAKRELDGPTNMQGNYQLQGRFSANISDTHAWLKIRQVQRSDQGKYKFDLNSRGSSGINHEVEVMVHSPPRFTNVSSNSTLHEGSHLLLFCEATGKPLPNIAWVRIFPNGSESGVLHRNDTWEFKKINRNEAFTYRCTADNGVGDPVSHKIGVTVKFPPETRLQTKYVVGRGKSKLLLCQVEGYPTPSIIWTPCKPDGNVCDKSRLNVPDVKEDVVYTCTAQNNLGSNSSSTNLVIGAEIINLTLAITSEKCIEGDTSFWTKLEEPVTRLFKDKNGFTSVTLRGHRCGSLIVDLALKFTEIVSETWVLDTLRNETKNNKLGELLVNSSSIAGIVVIESTATPPTGKTTKKPSDDNTVVIIVAIVVPIAAAIIVGVVLFIIWKKKKNKKKVNKEVGDKNPGGQKMKQIGGRSSDGHGNNGYENTGSSSRRPEKTAEITYTVVEQDKGNSVSRTSGGGPKKPPRSFEAETQQQSVDGRNKAKKSKKEQAQEKPVGVVYAQVDKTKKKPKKPEATYDQAERPGSKGPGELTYAMLEHGQGSSMPRNAASQVRKPQPYVETEYAMIV